MNRIEYSTMTQVEVNRAEIAAAVAAYEAKGGQITVLEGFQYVPRPKPMFNHKISSERERHTKKVRARQGIPKNPKTPPEKRAEFAKQLQLMAELGMAKWTAISKLECGHELAEFIIEEHQVVFRPKKTIKDVADAFCGVTV